MVSASCPNLQSTFDQHCVENEGSKQGKAELSTKPGAPELQAPDGVTYTDTDLTTRTFEDVKSARLFSPNAWIHCRPGVWLLDCFGKGILKIELTVSDGKTETQPGITLRTWSSHVYGSCWLMTPAYSFQLKVKRTTLAPSHRQIRTIRMGREVPCEGSAKLLQLPRSNRH